MNHHCTTDFSPTPAPPVMHSTLRLGMVAGEASGDLLASLLLTGAHQHWAQVHAWGIGGAHMQAQGFDALWLSDALSVHGYSLEVLRRVYGIWRIRNQLRQHLLAQRPDVFVGVDAPDFNLSLHADLRRHGIATVQMVCPSVWAWRPERIPAIRRAVRHVLCIFPFEPALLAAHDIAATYIGHPLAQIIPMQPDAAAARAALHLPEEAEVLAVLPGSRTGEITYLAPRFLHAIRLLQQQRPGLRAIIPTVPAQLARVQHIVHSQHMAQSVQVLAGQSHLALAACSATLIASGTATLEAALFKRPMVIAYAMHPLSAALMRRKQLQPWIGLPNILCRDFVVPELLQEQATPDRLARAISDWLDDPTRTAAVQQRFTALHHELLRDTATLASRAIAQCIGLTIRD